MEMNDVDTTLAKFVVMHKEQNLFKKTLNKKHLVETMKVFGHIFLR